MIAVHLIAGLVLLVVGAEWLVKGASRLATTFGISQLVIGLTIVAFGTSAPEMAVSVGSAWSGQADLAVGNVVGSNIFNVLFILGCAALISPLIVAQQLVRLDVPLMIGASFIALFLGLDGSISRLDGLLLFSAIVGYTVFLIRQSRAQNLNSVSENSAPSTSTPPARAGINGLLIIAGLALLVLGSRLLVSGAVRLAELFEVSELIIGLTIVAAGTSLPELATSVIASLRGERDIAVGNVVGSNVFNLFAVLGLSSLVSPAGIPVASSLLAFDIPVMIGVAVACLPIFFTGYRISRWNGAVFLFYYAVYTAYLIMAATDHDALHGLASVMLWFVIPMTTVVLLTLAARHHLKPRA